MLTVSLPAAGYPEPSNKKQKSAQGMFMRPIAQTRAPAPQLLFLPGVYNETLSLLFDAHQYFQERGADEQAALGPQQRTAYSQEMGRVTLRLTSVMAWIMVRRAIHAGRIAQEKAAQDYRLDGPEFCLAPDPEAMDRLPHYLGYLADRSRQLYERVHRLDQMAYH